MQTVCCVYVQITRLHALKDLHERAAQFASSVALMSDSQDQLSRQTSELQALLIKVQFENLFDSLLLSLSSQMEASFKENLSTVQSNFASLESRINTIKK